MRSLLMAIALFLICAWSASGQSVPVLSGTLKAGGVQSRNMELLDVVPFRPGSGEMFDSHTVPYVSGGVSKKKQLLLTVFNESSGNNRIRIIDVTNPRGVNEEYITITVQNQSTVDQESGARIKLEQLVAYTDSHTPDTETFNGDVFLVVRVEDLLYVEGSLLDFARFIIINLSKAVALRESGSTSLIEIYNGAQRNVKYNGAKLSPANRDIYIGYIKDLSDIEHPHNIGLDQKSGILALATIHPTIVSSVNYAYTDLFDLKEIVAKCAKGNTALGQLPRLTMTGGTTPITIPRPTVGSNTPLLYPHEIVPHYLTDTKVRLFIASFGVGNPADVAGGVTIVDVDYSTPLASTVTAPIYWPYDMDREKPNQQFSSYTGTWGYRPSHTAAPFFHTNTSDVFVVTTDEFAGPRYNQLEQSGNPINAVGGLWKGGIGPIDVDPTAAELQDDRRIGGFVRVWNTQMSGGVLNLVGTGTATYPGPLSLYDPIESVDPNDLYYSSRRQVGTSSLATACTAGSNETLGPNTVHRVHTISSYNSSMYTANGNDVVVSAYAAGCRVINLDNTASNGTTLEKAFFDFIPKLSYDKNSEYFYKMSSGWAGLDKFLALQNIGAYFLGVWHSVADFGTSRPGTNGTGTLPEDEKFIHIMGFGEGQITENSTANALYPKDPAAVLTAGGRNWIHDGGFMMLRYFDGKLGGTISGYTGTNEWADRSYRTVNLQGEFTVERDVTVAAGACVQLLPGHVSDPGIFATTSLLPPSSGTKTVYVDGVLNISIAEGDVKGTDIVIDVPIVVRDGGILNIYNIRSGKKVMFKKKVIVQSGGTWKFHKSADVELYYEDHEANGKFIVDGDEDARVKITSRRNGTDYSKSAYIVGRGTTDNAKSLVSIEYADITNTFTDLDRISVNSSTFAIKESIFRTTRSAEKGARFLFKFTRPLSEYVNWGAFRRRQARVRIIDTEFMDAQSGVSALQSIQLAAMVSDAASLYLTRVEIDKFMVGLFAKDNDGVYITDCQVTNSTMGVVASNGSSVICNTEFYNNEFSSSKYGTGSGHFKDNNYSVMKGGANIQNSGVQYFRNNEFSAYCYGVQSWGTTLFMRNEVRTGNDIEYGRNDFLVNTDLYGVWGCATTDIGLARAAQLIVNCGYNQFTGASAYHVTGDNTCPDVDVSYNQWNPGAGYNPRFYNINWNGDNRDVQQDREDDCGIVVNNLVVCNSPVLPPRGGEGYSELGFNDTTLYVSASSVRAEVQDTTIGWRNRRDKAWEYFEIVSKIDSSTYQNVIKSDMQTILSNSSLDSNLRSAALFIKASVHSARGEYDSAKTALSTIRSSYPLKSDSVPAKWETLYINAITDTTSKVDSLIGVYLDQVLTDLRRKTTYGTTGLSKINLNRDEAITGSGLVVTMNGPTHPNPSTTGRAVMTITSNKSARCYVDVIDVQGMTAGSFEYSLSSGENRVEINTEKYTPGTYTARVRCDESINRVTFVVTR